MPVTFERAKPEITELLLKMRNKHHPGLCEPEVTTDILMTSEVDPETGEVLPTLKHNKYPAIAVIKITSLNLEVVTDNESGEPKLDDLQRPKLKLRLHDWELGGFTAVAQRHGKHAIEVKAVQACRDGKGQYFWDFEKLREVA